MRHTGIPRTRRHRYIVEDPVRFGCLASAASLVFVPEVPFALMLLVVLATQMAPVAMALRGMESDWSFRWGRRVHESVFASNLCMDVVNFSACAVVGALLLVRLFNGAGGVRPLAMLAAAICFIPDIRLCRLVLAGDPHESSRRLREGYFYRDPVMLGALLGAGAVCVMDAGSLHFVAVSLALFMVNAFLVLGDKYLPQVGSGLLLGREGRRFWIALGPMALVPVGAYAGDRVYWGAGVLAAAVVVPDLVRMALAGMRAVTNLLRMTPSPATFITVRT